MAINYNPTKWENGKTILKASHFEKIEKGITDIINYNNSIYTDEDKRKENEIKREEEHNKKIKEVDTLVDDLKSDYDALEKIIIDENTSANLQNQINDVNSQLAHNTSYMLEQISLKANNDDLAQMDNKKADKSYVENLTNSLASGSPRGVYSNLEELKIALPNGSSNIYLTTDNGCWNYWSGSEWLNGGVYNAITVQDYSININKLDIIYQQGRVIQGCLDFDFNENWLKIEENTIISDNTGFYSVLNTDNIPFVGDATPKYVFFNTNTRLLHIEERWFKVDPKELLIACYYQKNVFFVNNNDLIKMNGKNIPLKGEVDRHNLKDKSISKEKLWFSFTHGAFIDGGLNIDLNNKTIDIKDGSFVSDLTGPYQVANSNSQISFKSFETGFPLYIYFNIGDCNIHIENRWFSYDANELLICTIYRGKILNTISNGFIFVSGEKVDNDFTFKGKKFVSYGDSITESNKWQDYLVNELDITHINKGLSSSCISNFETWALSMSNDERLNEIPLDADIITIMGGTNDWVARRTIGTLEDETKDTFIGAYKYIIETLMNKAPNARIIIMSPPFGYYNAGIGTEEINGVGVHLKDFVNAVRDVANYYKLPFINVYENLGVNKINKDIYFYDEDVQVHPNVNGGKRIAGLVLGKLKELNC